MAISTLDFLNELDVPSRQVVDLPITLIDPDPNQPRKAFHAIDGMVVPEEEEALQELADDIAENTQLQPILVQEVADGRYQIVSGERRWRAVRLNNSRGMPNSGTIQAIIRQDISGVKVRLAQLGENMGRRDLTDIEVATFLKTILDEFPELQKRDIAKLLKRNSQYVSRILALVDPRWSDVVLTGVITYASLLEGFKSLPEYKQAELKERAVKENRPLTSGDIKHARDEHRKANPGLVPPEIPKVSSAAEAISNLGLADLTQGPVDPEGGNHQPSATAPTPTKEIIDHGGDAIIPRPGDLVLPVLGKREVKLTISQLIILCDKARVSENHTISVFLPTEELRSVIEDLKGEVPEDDDQLVMTLINLLNEKPEKPEKQKSGKATSSRKKQGR
jgi:ParB family chromosome partitioning protein